MNNSASIQLVKCSIVNAEGEPSFRLIERENYDLWRFLVMNRHDIKIREPRLCLWVSEDEFDAKRQIYSRAGDAVHANQLTLMMYDSNDASSTTRRFCLGTDSRELEKILVRHIPRPIRDAEQFDLSVEIGVIIDSGPLRQINLLDYADFDNQSA